MKPRQFVLCMLFIVGVVAGLSFVLTLVGCTPAAAFQLPSPNVRVVNSAWQVVREATLAREITSTDDLQADVDAYNQSHTDDQWWLIYGEVPPIEAAPTVDAFIVFADTHEVSSKYLGIERADLVARRNMWRLQIDLDSQGGRPCVLYVDNIPPAPEPVVVVPVDPYVAYAIYVLDSSGAVLWEEHATAEDYATRLNAWRLSCEVQNGAHPEDPWTMVTGRLL